MSRSASARLLKAYEILQDLLDEGRPEDLDPGFVPSHWDLPAMPPPDPSGRLSATDLLGWWFRAPGGLPDPWEAYFEGPVPDPPPVSPQTPGPRPPERPINGWRPEDWHPAFAQVRLPDRLLPDESAEAAVETLYEFLHAVGRRDVEAAMAVTAEDYHVMEGDLEVDRLGLRQRLEALLDSLGGWSLEVSLAVAPEPLDHPYGVLIAADIQLDAAHPDGAKRSHLWRRVALLRQDGEGEWKIHALSLVPA